MITINSIFEKVPCGYILLNNQGIIKDANKKFLEMIEYEYEDVIDKHIEGFLSVVSKMLIHSLFFVQLPVTGTVEELYLTFKNKNGFDIPVLLNGNRESDELINCILVRMNKRIEYEEELQNIREELEAAYKEKNLALDNARKKTEELEYLSYHDQLTGVCNRHFFNTIIAEKMDKADSLNEPISMAILDLDHFKNVNDTWGHPVGDEVLKLTAKTTSDVKDDSDFFVRLGGEEFVILMPHTKIKEAAFKAEKIRTAIEENPHPITGRQTVSIGVAERLKYESFKNWYRRMDDSLYRAKQGGRNQVVSSDGNESFPDMGDYIDLNKESLIGNKEIDKQHNDINTIAKQLIGLVQENKEHREIMSVMELLTSHIIDHFEYEDKYLCDIQYPGFNLHADEHRSLIAKLLQVKDNYGRGEVKPAALLSFIVDDVMIGHFQNEDIKYFIYIK